MTQVSAPVFATHGMVVAGHPLGALEGLRVLEAGGTAADAAIAAAAALCVVLPQACTVGGDAFMLVHPGDGGSTLGLNASGPSGAAATPDRYAGGIPARGPGSISVPGMVRGWEAMHQRFGRLPWAEVLAPAARLAKAGFPVSHGVARASERYHEVLAQDPGSRRILLAGGAPLRPGSILRQPALAATLESLAREGSEGFYAGAPAVSLERLCNERGGALARADLRDYRPVWVAPLSVDYRGVTVATLPPNSYGLYLLLQLLALETADPAPGRSAAERIALLVRAARLAFAEGAPFVADPAHAPPAGQALTPARRRRLREGMARVVPAPAPASGAGTAVVSAVDAEGNAVIIVQSIFLLFGSGVCDPDTGILFNNRMLGFTLEAGHANQVGPRKRPAHTLCPTMVFAGGGLRRLMGTPGGPSQTLTLTQVVSNLVDLAMPLAPAVGAPRWSMDLEGRCLLEPAFGDEVLEALAAQGIEAARAEAGSPFFGSVEAIEIMDDGVLQGVADGRREACALGRCA